MTSSIIRLNIALNEKNCARVISITGLYGFPNRIYPVIQHFKQLLENTGAEFVKEEKEENNLAVPNFQTAYYQVSRFLSNTEIPSGKLYQAFIKEFYEKYSNIEKAAALSKEVLEYIKRIIDNINDLIIKTVSSNSRLAIEKYIYSKIFPQVKKIYEAKTFELSQNFEKKRKSLQDLNEDELMALLDVKEKFRIKGTKTPYFNAIENLNNLDKHSSPIDKLNCILESATQMKTTVIDYWKGKEELETMDDQLPVIIFIVTRTSLDCLPTQIEFLLDYTRTNAGMDNEHRLLINYDAAISFIIHEI